MRRTELKRKSGLRRSAKPMKRTRVRPVNRERKAERFDRNFGPESDAVRAMPCLCMDQDAGAFFYELELAHTHGVPDAIVLCSGDTEAAHAVPRGMGGANSDKYKIAPLCHAHHEEAGEARTSKRAAFELRYGLDLIAEADRIAASHAPPLGIRGLAQRWAKVEARHCPRCGGSGRESDGDGDLAGRCESPLCYLVNGLDDHDEDALLGWVRRECEREAERRRAAMLDANSKAMLLGFETYWWGHREPLALVQREQRSRGGAVWDGLADDDLGVLAAHVAAILGLDAGLAEQLLDAAGVGHE